MVVVLPAALAKLFGVALAELVKDRRVTYASPARGRVETVGTLRFEARKVEEAERPGPTDEHAVRFYGEKANSEFHWEGEDLQFGRP